MCRIRSLNLTRKIQNWKIKNHCVLHDFKACCVIAFAGLISRKKEIVFALDGSRRVDETMFGRMKKLVKASLKSYNISAPQTNVALVQYGGDTEIKLRLNQGTNLGTVEQSVNDLARVGGPRRMNKALRVIRMDIFNSLKRNDVLRLVVLFTTGKNSGDGSGELPSVARDLRSQGVEVIVVVIGKDSDPKEIEAITGKEVNAINVDDVTKLPETIGILEAKVGDTGGELSFSSSVHVDRSCKP